MTTVSRREALLGAVAVSTLGAEELSSNDLEVLRVAEFLERIGERGHDGRSWPKESGISQRILSLAVRGYFVERPDAPTWYLLTEKGRRALIEAA